MAKRFFLKIPQKRGRFKKMTHPNEGGEARAPVGFGLWSPLPNRDGVSKSGSWPGRWALGRKGTLAMPEACRSSVAHDSWHGCSSETG